MKTILISGSSGFIAHHTIKEFQQQGWRVIGVDKRPIPKDHSVPDHFIQCDVLDLGFRDLMGVDAIFHAAWRTNIPDCARHPVGSTKANIDMSIHLLELAREAGIKRFVFPSTASLYGENKTPWMEEMTVTPSEPYSWQKLAVELACQMYAKQYNLPTVILRFFQVFGEFQRDDTALAAFLRCKREGKPVTLTQTMAQSKFKSGQRDFVYAGDVAKAIVGAVKSENVGNGEIINICTGKVHTMEEIAEAMKAKVQWIPRRSWECERHEGDPTKARMLLNWKSETSVIEWLKHYA